MPRQILPHDSLHFVDFTVYKPTRVWINTKPQKCIELCKCPVCGRTGQLGTFSVDHKLRHRPSWRGGFYESEDSCECSKDQIKSLKEKAK